MRVGIVGDNLCYPATAGNRIRTLNLMVRLARRFDLTYFARGTGDPAADRSAVDHLQERGIRTVLVEGRPPPKTGIRFYSRALANLASAKPYSAAAWRVPGLDKVLDRWAAGRIQLWQFEALTHADLAPRLGRPTVMMAHNVEALIWQRYYETETRALKRRYLGLQWARMARWERRAFRRCTRVVTVSEPDADLARARYGLDAVDVVENGIDRGYFAAARGERDSREILFLGSLDWRPNQDAVRLLVKEILPKVLAAEPGARLTVVGRAAPGWLTREAAAQPRLEVHSDVPDVRPFLAKCGIMAVPLRVGGGSRLKILEALACGTPVVSTRVGAEGLDLEPGTHYAEAPGSEMADALLRCMREYPAALRAAERGRERVHERYDWDALAAKLEDVWEQAATAPAGDRQVTD